MMAKAAARMASPRELQEHCRVKGVSRWAVLFSVTVLVMHVLTAWLAGGFDMTLLVPIALLISSMALFTLVATAALLWLLDVLIGLRVDEESELQGLDLALHRERLSG